MDLLSQLKEIMHESTKQHLIHYGHSINFCFLNRRNERNCPLNIIIGKFPLMLMKLKKKKKILDCTFVNIWNDQDKYIVIYRECRNNIVPL